MRDILTFRGAGFVVPMAGDIKINAWNEFRPCIQTCGCGCKDRKGKRGFLIS